MSVFFFSVCHQYLGNSENATIFDISIFCDKKLNLIGQFVWSTLKILRNFRKLQQKQKRSGQFYATPS